MLDCFVASLPCANASRLSQAMTKGRDSNFPPASRLPSTSRSGTFAPKPATENAGYHQIRPDTAIRTPQGRSVMLTRRGFAGVASCAICAVTGFMATDASAQGTTPPATTPGVSRKILSQSDGPAPGYVTLLVAIEIEPGVTIGRHTHPGIESAYILEGGFELPIEGM